MTYGWAGRIFDVDLTTGKVSTRETKSYVPEWLGGRGLASRIAWEEIPGGVRPYDAENRIIIATGPLCGTLAPTSGRTVMGSVSPRIYPKPWYTHSTIGGWFGPELKYAGYDAIVIKGKASSPVYLDINDERVRIEDASELWGKDARETQLALRGKLGQQTQILTIGPAGENRVVFATVQHAEENAAGHSGFGAVWGSKNLKAIAVKGTNGVSVANPEALLREVLKAGVGRKSPAVAVLREKRNRGVPREIVSQPQGSERPICSQACTFNCFVGTYERARDGRRVPAFCIGGIWRQDAFAPATEYRGGGVNVPPSRGFGHDENVALHELCNNLGIDLWFRLVMHPWLIRCRELGVNEIRGHALEPENAEWFREFMRQMAHRQGLGAIFADDLRRAMDELEGELPDELIGLGRELEFNFGFPAHREGRFWDGEPLPFWVISAMMHLGANRDPTIGTHQSCLLNAEFLIANRELYRKQFRRLSEKVWGYADALEPTFENKAPVAIWAQDQHVLIDSLPLCDFAYPQLVKPMMDREEWESSEEIAGDIDLGRRLFEAVTGVAYTWDDLRRITQRVFNIERVMLARSGRERAMEAQLAPHFQLPCASDGTLLTEQGFSRLMDEYYAARGWDLKHGWPTGEALRSLGLGEAAAEMDVLRQRTR
jgi:aldehyde:ferredoxin oxidoreductase